MTNIQMCVRFKPEEMSRVDNLIAAGEFGNRTEFIQYAVRKALKTFEENGGTRIPPRG